MIEQLKLWERDPWLEPFKREIWKRYSKSVIKRLSLTGYNKTLSEIANNHLYYGAFRMGERGHLFREWAPNATALYLICDANGWKKSEEFTFTQIGGGNWELKLESSPLEHGSLYRWLICWEGGEGERLPAYARRVVQDQESKLFSAQIWEAEPYQWRATELERVENPLIYEAHIGMSSEREEVASFNHFREEILPIVAHLGYNTLQLMAIMEHPYYGSFGYQVANFFAVSSRFGTPEELKELIDSAHQMGIAVILDIVHSHSVSNTLEGLSLFDGREDLYFHGGERGYHPAWNSRCFNYGRDETLFFLLSNCKYWLEEFKFDGFRFDGVTSMIYQHHGLGYHFNHYSNYFDGSQDLEALTYLTLANQLVKEINPNAITIAEEVSGYPGLAAPIEEGGVGFDFRLSMGVPDLWIKWIKELKDQEWDMEQLYYELTRKRVEERSISYAESHDQALVGDKTLLFRLLDSEIYHSMSRESSSPTIERGIALHKLIRAITLTTAGDGYLNFMGNEFGHPEWIDFPREGNNWSYHYARRMWGLAFDQNLRYSHLFQFDRALIKFAKESALFSSSLTPLYLNNEQQIIIFERKGALFAFNFNPENSYPNLSFRAAKGSYKIVLDSDSKLFGGFDRVDNSTPYQTYQSGDCHKLSIYLPSRTLLIFKIL